MKTIKKIALACSVLCAGWGGALNSDPASAAPKVYGLVVGIDDYETIAPLEGAVNDAELIAKTLQAADADDLILLTDAEASRQKVMSSFRLLKEKAQPGDWIVFTYAGHGGQEDEAIPGDETDGKDEVVLLAGFGSTGAGTAERLRDNEIAQLFSEVDRSVNIIFLADACHSGTMSRTVDPLAPQPRLRMTRYGPITDDSLPPPPAETKSMEVDAFPNVITLSAALDREVTPEFVINGQPHGALSWYFSRAIGGAADLNGDEVTTLSELRTYVTGAVRTKSESRQTPGVQYTAGRANEALPFASSKNAQLLLETPDNLAVWVENDEGVDEAALKAMRGIRLASARETADLIWDASTGHVINAHLGDRVAEGVRAPVALAGIADKWRAMPDLIELANANPLTVSITPGGPEKLYTDGERVTIKAAKRKDPTLTFLTTINIASDGTVQLIYPHDPQKAQSFSPHMSPPLRADVSGPYGADHVIMLATPTKPDLFWGTLLALDGKAAAGEVVAAIQDAVKDGAYQLGVVGFYTQAK